MLQLTRMMRVLLYVILFWRSPNSRARAHPDRTGKLDHPVPTGTVYAGGEIRAATDREAEKEHRGGTPQACAPYPLALAA